MIPLGVLASGYVAPAGGSWTPADLTSLDLWLDASTLAGYSESNPVPLWEDQSTAGNNAVSSGTAQPTYTTSPGFPALSFNGSTSYMTSPASRSSSTQTIIAVVLAATDVTNGTVASGNGLSSGTMDKSSAYRMQARIWGTAAVQPLGYNTWGQNTWGVFAVTLDTDADKIAMRASSSVGDFTVSGATTATMASGRTTVIGAKGSSAAEKWNGLIAELICCSAVPSTADMDAAFAYLTDKYGI